MLLMLLGKRSELPKRRGKAGVVGVQQVPGPTPLGIHELPESDKRRLQERPPDFHRSTLKCRVRGGPSRRRSLLTSCCRRRERPGDLHGAWRDGGAVDMVTDPADPGAGPHGHTCASLGRFLHMRVSSTPSIKQG